MLGVAVKTRSLKIRYDFVTKNLYFHAHISSHRSLRTPSSAAITRLPFMVATFSEFFKVLSASLSSYSSMKLLCSKSLRTHKISFICTLLYLFRLPLHFAMSYWRGWSLNLEGCYATRHPFNYQYLSMQGFWATHTQGCPTLDSRCAWWTAPRHSTLSQICGRSIASQFWKLLCSYTETSFFTRNRSPGFEGCLCTTVCS